jgi:hypothetical protein
VHGEEDAIAALGKELRNRGTRVTQPRPGEVLEID